MNRLARLRTSYRRATAWFVALLLACLALGAGLAFAQTGATRNFDHLKTGFALTGAHVQARCESCHLNGIFKGTPRDCASCHVAGMGYSRGNVVRPLNHVPSSLACSTCHNTKTYLGANFSHQGVAAGSCQSCHNGGTASGKPANHVPYASLPVAAAAKCDTCHKGSFTTWANGRFHSNFGVSSGCVTCHTLSAGGSYLSAAGKPATATHATVTGNCENCHRSTTSWSSATFAHSPANAVGTGTCDTCHNGTTAKGRPATHIPITSGAARCDSCHKSQASFATAVTMNHTVVATQSCKLCHNGSYTSQGTQGALAKPANHIPEVQLLNGAAMECSACHTSTASWTAMTMNHNGSLGNGAGSCKACHQSGTSFLGSMQKKSLTHQKATGVTDCSQSGCHRPLGNKGNAYRNWD